MLAFVRCSAPILAGLAACSGRLFDWRDAPLSAYKLEHYRALGRRVVGTANEDRLLEEALRAPVVYLGDHHRDRRLHGRLLAFLDRLERRGARITLALEAIGVQDERAVADFLARRIDLDELRWRIRQRWPGSWLDRPDVDRDFYRRLLGRARRGGWAVFGLEPAPRPPLAHRDRVIAARLRELARRRRDLLVVIIGHAHLLGDGHVVARAGLSGPVVAPRAPLPLQAAAERLIAKRPGAIPRTEKGVWLLVPAREAPQRESTPAAPAW